MQTLEKDGRVFCKKHEMLPASGKGQSAQACFALETFLEKLSLMGHDLQLRQSWWTILPGIYLQPLVYEIRQYESCPDPDRRTARLKQYIQGQKIAHPAGQPDQIAGGGQGGPDQLRAESDPKRHGYKKGRFQRQIVKMINLAGCGYPGNIQNGRTFQVLPGHLLLALGQDLLIIMHLAPPASSFFL